jgi:predicted Zn-dependent protease
MGIQHIRRGGAAFFLAVLTVTGLGSCRTLANATGLAAQAAGDAGLIDPVVSDSIVSSAGAINRAAEEITPEQEYYIGRAVGAHILIRYQVDNSRPAFTAYLNRIANALVINSARPVWYNGCHVAILDSPEINAFATSGGHIFVTQGLLENAASEDALAAVLAHEIAHIQLRHSIGAIKTSRITQAIIATGSSAVTAATHGTSLEELTDIFDESVTEIVSTLINNGYSQTQEFAADALALSLLDSAGYHPASLIDMLRALEKSQPNRPGGFNTTHPSPGDRISRAEREVRRYATPDTRAYRRPRFNALR